MQINFIEANQLGEGFHFYQGKGYYEPEKYNKKFDTHAMEDGELRYKVSRLPKTRIKVINAYGKMTPQVSKFMKHSVDLKGNPIGKNTREEGRSLDLFMDKTVIYLSQIIKKELPDVDFVVCPQSSSKLNTDICKGIVENLGYAEFIDNAFVKSVDNIRIDDYWLKKKENEGHPLLTSTELFTLRRQVDKWKKEKIARGLQKELLQIQSEIDVLREYDKGRRGRPSTRKIREREAMIDTIQKEIENERKGMRGRYGYKDEQGNVKDWQIKTLSEKTREAITGFMQINDELYNRLEKKFYSKKFVIFDDNISSGASLDDCCNRLLKNNVPMENILVITLGAMDPTVYSRSERTSSAIKF